MTIHAPPTRPTGDCHWQCVGSLVILCHNSEQVLDPETLNNDTLRTLTLSGFRMATY